MKQTVRAFAPATVANAISGFDVLGFAMEKPGDIVTCTLSNKAGIRIAPLQAPYHELPTDPTLNTAGVAVQALLDTYDLQVGLDLVIEKGVPIVGGMGSSASSAVAAVVAVKHLLGLPGSNIDLLPFVLESERVATGVPHADNVAPSLMGGFSLVRSVDPLDIIAIDMPETFACALVHPDIQIKTMDARKILPQQISMKVATRQMGHISGFITGMFTHDLDLISRSLVDELAEPHRSKLIPGYDQVKAAAIKKGALGCGISGSGPSMFALCATKEIAKTAGSAMQAAFREVKLQSDVFLSNISQQGAHVIA